MTDTAQTPEQIAAALEAAKAAKKAERVAKKAAYNLLTPAQKAELAVVKAQEALTKAQAVASKAVNAGADLAFSRLFNAWADSKGHPNGKGNRRASNLALISEWEADVTAGVIASLNEEVNDVVESTLDSQASEGVEVSGQ